MRDRTPAARTLTSPGAPALAEGRPNARTRACPLHDFVPWRPRLLRCTRCGLGLDEDCVAWYRLGLEHGRLDAWARPDGPRREPRARWFAAALALGLSLVGAAPVERLPESPPHEALEALGDCLAAAEVLEADVESVWGRLLGTRCPDDACRADAFERARFNRERHRTAVSAAASAQSSLVHALDDARRCSSSGSPPCASYAPPVLAEQRADVAASARALRTQVEHVRLSTDTARP
jgi:hypothetical protein